ncbi:pyridoxal kinase [Ostrinia nubilalis]|uniref:pyridoxal kinase n=1 Tax=Ostrinia nubilalis TaxID=29057 RepID=UPI00308232BD
MNSSDSTPRVLSIQSHVVHGYVGNKSAVFPLQVLGFEVDSINTVQFSTHTGYKHIKGNVLKNEELEELVQGLTLNEVDYYTHFLTGYSRSPDSLKQIAEIIKKLRQKNPDLVYVCDPVMGDNGKMYVPEEILPVYRDIVVPLADILTPNQFEAELITGIQMKDLDGALKVVRALHDKGVKTVVISSTDLGDDKTMIGIASTKGSCYKIEMQKHDASFTGTGDLLAALFLAWSHKTNNNVKLTLEKTIATMQSIVKDTYQRARAIQATGKVTPALIELRLIQNKKVIEEPVIEINAIEIKAP